MEDCCRLRSRSDEVAGADLRMHRSSSSLKGMKARCSPSAARSSRICVALICCAGTTSCEQTQRGAEQRVDTHGVSERFTERCW